MFSASSEHSQVSTNTKDRLAAKAAAKLQSGDEILDQNGYRQLQKHNQIVVHGDQPNQYIPKVKHALFDIILY